MTDDETAAAAGSFASLEAERKRGLLASLANRKNRAEDKALLQRVAEAIYGEQPDEAVRDAALALARKSRTVARALTSFCARRPDRMKPEELDVFAASSLDADLDPKTRRHFVRLLPANPDLAEIARRAATLVSQRKINADTALAIISALGGEQRGLRIEIAQAAAEAFGRESPEYARLVKAVPELALPPALETPLMRIRRSLKNLSTLDAAEFRNVLLESRLVEPDNKTRRQLSSDLARNPGLAQLPEAFLEVLRAEADVASWTVVMLAVALGSRGEEDKAAEIIRTYLDRLPEERADVRESLLSRLTELLVKRSRFEEADTAASALLEMGARSKRAKRVAAWRSARAGHVEEARAFFMDADVEIEPALETSYAKCELDEISRPARSAPSDVKIFLTTNNEIELIGTFLEYYRKLASCTFYVVDNESNDGTRDYLAAQGDVHLYHTAESFLRSGFGSTWINRLITRHSRADEFCLRLDADEFLVYPDFDRLALPDLLNRLARSDYDLVSGPMVDLYPADISFAGPERKDGDWVLSSSKYFDALYKESPSLLPPYLSGWGGVRDRLFGGPTFLTKTPLVRGGGKILYYVANHYTTPGRSVDFTCALLHYKFTPDSYIRYKHQVERGQHFNGGLRYRKFLRLLDSGKTDIRDSDTREYSDWRDLEKAGIMHASAFTAGLASGA